MKTYTVYYSTGITWKTDSKSIRGAKIIASKYFSYQCQLNKDTVEIYLDGILISSKTGFERWINH